jgi:hypothetical protein
MLLAVLYSLAAAELTSLLKKNSVWMDFFENKWPSNPQVYETLK